VGPRLPNLYLIINKKYLIIKENVHCCSLIPKSIPNNKEKRAMDGASPIWNPELVTRDDGNIAGVEDAPDGARVVHAREGGSHLDSRSRRLLPHGGCQLEGTSRRGKRGG
jgi:hypothetical protein